MITLTLRNQASKHHSQTCTVVEQNWIKILDSWFVPSFFCFLFPLACPWEQRFDLCCGELQDQRAPSSRQIFEGSLCFFTKTTEFCHKNLSHFSSYLCCSILWWFKDTCVLQCGIEGLKGLTPQWEAVLKVSPECVLEVWALPQCSTTVLNVWIQLSLVLT